jgi:hypothetical protein
MKCHNCQQVCPEGERLCAECFEVDFKGLKSRLKAPERFNRDRLKIMDRMGAMKLRMPAECVLRDLNRN